MPDSVCADVDSPGWHLRAACRTHPDPDLWHAPNPTDQQAAVAVCRTCPAVGPCLAYAVARREEHGVWGATTPRDRRAALRAANGETLVTAAGVLRG